MKPKPAAKHLDLESRAYVGEFLLARATMVIRALTPKNKLPAGAYDIDPYAMADLAELVNEFARLDFADQLGKRGRKPAAEKMIAGQVRRNPIKRHVRNKASTPP